LKICNSKFEDFKLHLEFKCGPSSNGGVFLCGRYEVQIETDSVAEANSHHTGWVNGFLDPTPKQPRKADVWQTFDITLVRRRITVVQNGITIIDNRKIPGITGGSLDSHEALPVPLYFQGTEEGTVTFRNISSHREKIRRLPLVLMQSRTALGFDETEIAQSGLAIERKVRTPLPKIRFQTNISIEKRRNSL
jgi:hypothetical protein